MSKRFRWIAVVMRDVDVDTMSHIVRLGKCLKRSAKEENGGKGKMCLSEACRRGGSHGCGG